MQDIGKRCRGLVGRTCIYRERRILWVVDVVKVKVTKEMVCFKLRAKACPGFTGGDAGEFSVSASFFVLGATPCALSAAYVSWMLYDAAALVESTIAFAATVASESDADNRIRDYIGQTQADLEKNAPTAG